MIWSSLKFAHVTEAGMSWHVQNCDLFASLESKLKLTEMCTKFRIWIDKPFVKLSQLAYKYIKILLVILWVLYVWLIYIMQHHLIEAKWCIYSSVN